MRNGGISNTALCEPTCAPLQAAPTLKDKMFEVRSRMEDVKCLAKEIHGELYGFLPADGQNQPDSIDSFETLIDEMNQLSREICDVLYDASERLKG